MKDRFKNPLYMPSVVMEFVRKYISVLDSKTIHVMIEDIEREAEFETLDKRGDWLKLRDDLKAYYSEMLQKSENSKTDQ